MRGLSAIRRSCRNFRRCPARGCHRATRLHVEAGRVRNVEHFPAELQALFLRSRAWSSACETQVDTEVAGAANVVALAGFSRIRGRKRRNRTGTVGKAIGTPPIKYVPVFTGPILSALPSSSKLVGKLLVPLSTRDRETAGDAETRPSSCQPRWRRRAGGSSRGRTAGRARWGNS